MPLGLSLGEVAVLLTVTAAVVGPKDVPVVARGAGRAAGRAVGYLLAARRRLDAIVGRSQIAELHREVQDAMVQLEAIRHEIRGVGSLASSRALARGLAGDSGSPDRAAFAHAEHSQAGPAAIGRPEVPKIKAEAPGRSLGHRPEQPSAAPPLDVLPMSAVSAGLLPRRYGEPGEQAGHRLDVMPSGADILSDAIVERQVAWQAYEFLRRSRGS